MAFDVRRRKLWAAALGCIVVVFSLVAVEAAAARPAGKHSKLRHSCLVRSRHHRSHRARVCHRRRRRRLAHTARKSWHPGSTTTSRSGSTTSGSGSSVLWGAEIGTQFTGSQAPWSWPAVTDFQSADTGGKSLGVLGWYSRFYAPTDCGGACTFSSSLFSAVRNAGAIPFLSLGSDSSSGGSGYTDAQIVGGSQDAYLTQFAQAAKAWGHPFFLRFDWEMNGNWMPWGVGANGNTAASYVAMWKHVHDIFTGVGATNVSWVWCPNIDNSNQFASMASLYPGDAYVDWTCLDGYNGDVPWTSFHDLFSSGYSNITGTIAPSKPMIIGETGSTESGGSKAQWITNMLSDLPTSFPKIGGLVWYDESVSGPGGHSDWPIESSSSCRGRVRQRHQELDLHHQQLRQPQHQPHPATGIGSDRSFDPAV